MATLKPSNQSSSDRLRVYDRIDSARVDFESEESDYQGRRSLEVLLGTREYCYKELSDPCEWSDIASIIFNSIFLVIYSFFIHFDSRQIIHSMNQQIYQREHIMSNLTNWRWVNNRSDFYSAYKRYSQSTLTML